MTPICVYINHCSILIPLTKNKMENQTLKEKVINFYFHRSGDTVQYKQKLLFQVNFEKSDKPCKYKEKS